MITHGVNSAAHLTTTGVASAVPCVLHTVTVNTKAGAASAITIFDNASAASGTVIGIIDATVPGTYTYDVVCTNGVFLSYSAQTPDITVSFMKWPN